MEGTHTAASGVSAQAVSLDGPTSFLRLGTRWRLLSGTVPQDFGQGGMGHDEPRCARPDEFGHGVGARRQRAKRFARAALGEALDVGLRRALGVAPASPAGGLPEMPKPPCERRRRHGGDGAIGVLRWNRGQHESTSGSSHRSPDSCSRSIHLTRPWAKRTAGNRRAPGRAHATGPAALSALLLGAAASIPGHAQSPAFTPRWSLASVPESGSTTLTITTAEATVTDDTHVLVTLHVGRDEGTADPSDIEVRMPMAGRNAQGQPEGYDDVLVSPGTIERRVHHNGGWIYVRDRVSYLQARTSALTLSVLDDADTVSEELAVWVYVDGELAGARTLTLTPAGTTSPVTTPPVFSDTTLTRSLAENTAANTNVGAAIPAATDADGDTLTYTMEGTDAASFTFDAATRRIKTRTGVTYDFEAKASYAVTIKADDGNGGTDTVAVTVTLTDADEPPAAPAAPAVTATSGSTTSLDVSWSAPANSGKPAIASYDLQYRAGTGGSFTDGPQDVTGTAATIPSLTAGTAYEVRVRATNAEGDSGWSGSGSGTTNATANTAPTVANAIPDRTAAAGTAFSYAFPDTTFNDADTGDTLSYAATQADGAALPTWLVFTAATRTFSGTPAATDVGTVSVKVTASDGNGGSVSDEFDIVVRASNTAPTASDARVTTVEDTDYTFGARDFNFADADGDALASVKIVSLPGSDEGSLRLNGAAIASDDLPKPVTKAELDAGKLELRPVAGQFGDGYASSFTFKVDDGGADSASAYTMTVNVAADPAWSELVGNLAEAVSSTALDVGQATTIARQLFTTGAHPHGYVLRSVGIELAGNGFSGAETLTVAVHALDPTPTDSGRPAAAPLHTLSGPWASGSAIPTDATVRFTAASGTTLEPNTRYFVFVSGSGDAAADASLERTESDDEAGEPSWSIYNGMARNNEPNLRLSVRGREVSGTEVSTREDTDYTFAAPDFVVAGGGAVAGVAIAALPGRGRGALKFDGTALGASDLPKTVTAAELAAGKLVYSPVTGQFGRGYTSLTFTAGGAAHLMSIHIEPDPAHTVLVGNFLRDTSTQSSGDTGKVFTQRFRSGDNPAGYGLHSVGIRVDSRLGSGPLRLSLAVYDTDADGSPKDVLYTLTNPWPSVNDVPRYPPVVWFPAPAGAALDPDTPYHVAVQTPGGSSANLVSIGATPSDEETGAPGWSVADAWHLNGSPGGGNSIQIGVRGHPRGAFFGSDAYTATEGGAEATVTVTLGPAPATALTIPLAVKSYGGGATAADHSAIPAQLVFGAGQRSASFAVAATDDTLDDDGERVTIGFGALPGAYAGSASASTTVALVDNEESVAFDAAAYTAIEGGTVAPVTVTLGAAPAQRIEIPLTATANGTASAADYSGVPQTLAFAAGQRRARFTVSATDDTLDDDGESLTLAFGEALPAPYVRGEVPEATVSLLDDDAPAGADNAVSTPAATDYAFAAGDFMLVAMDGDFLAGVTIVTLPDKGTLTLAGAALTAGDVVTRADLDAGRLLYVPPAGESGDGLGSFTFKVNDGHGDSAATYTMTVDVATATTPVRLVRNGFAPTVDTRDANRAAQAFTTGPGRYTLTGIVLHGSFLAGQSSTVTLHEGSRTGTKVADFTSARENNGFDLVLTPTRRTAIGGSKTYWVVTGNDFGEGSRWNVTDLPDEGGGAAAGWSIANDHEFFQTGTSMWVTQPGTIRKLTVNGFAGIARDIDIDVAFASAGYTATEGGSAATVEVTLSRAPGAEVQIPLALVSRNWGALAGDHSAIPATLTFAATETGKTFTVTATDDDSNDDGESVTIGFGALPGGYAAGRAARTTVSLADDDTLLVSNTRQTPAARSNASLGDVLHLIGFDPGANTGGYALESVEITLETAGSTDIGVPDVLLEPLGGSERIVLSGPDSLEPDTTQRYTFTAPAGTTLKPSNGYDVTVYDDPGTAPDSGNVYWRHTASTAEDAGSAPGWAIDDRGFRSISSVSTVGTSPLLLRVNGNPVLSYAPGDIEVSFAAAAYTAAEGGAAATVEVTLGRAPRAPVRIPLVVSRAGGAQSSDHSAVPATVAFGAGQRSRSFTVRAVDDAHDDDGESIVLGFGVLPAGFGASPGATATVRLEDDDGHRALVSNLRQRQNNHIDLQFDSAQGFMTGPNPHGYALTGVDVNIRTDPGRGVVEVPAVRVVSGAPDAAGGVGLAGPASVHAEAGAITARVYRFAAPPLTYLDGSTRYWIVAESNRPDDNAVSISVTNSPDEDPGSAAGWGIEDIGLARVAISDEAFSGGTSGPLMLAVLGAPLDAPYNRPATGEPGLAGFVRQGGTLAAEVPGSIEDGNGLSAPDWTYRWVRTRNGADEDIAGATSAAYTLAAADVAHTVSVEVSFTDDDGFAESRRSASTAVVPARVADTSGTVAVPANWALIPPGSNLGAGGRFRLIFVTAHPGVAAENRETYDLTDATSTEIEDYNEFVQLAAVNGHAALGDYAGHFRALASTAAVNARDNTATAAGDVDTRIYWLGHAGRADDSLAEFYDTTPWRKKTNQQDEDGNAVAMGLNAFVWTGTNTDGTTATAPLGSANPTVAEPNRTFGQLNNNETKPNTSLFPLYALSGVFEVAAPPGGSGPRTQVLRLGPAPPGTAGGRPGAGGGSDAPGAPDWGAAEGRGAGEPNATGASAPMRPAPARDTPPVTWGAPVPRFDIVLPEDANPTGLWSDGETLWVIEDWTAARVAAYPLAAAQADAGHGPATAPQGFTLAGGSGYPAGLWSDGQTLWVADYLGGVRAYRLSDNARLPRRDIPDGVLGAAGNVQPTALWSDGQTLWVADAGASRVFAYGLEHGQRVAEKEFEPLDARGLPLGAWGLWSDGATALVSDSLNGGVLKVALPGGALPGGAPPGGERDAGPALEGLEAQGRPMGLWSDHATLWVVDALERRIRAYPVSGLRPPEPGKPPDVFALEVQTRADTVEAAGAPVYVPDAALREAVAGALGLGPHEAVGARAMAALRSLDLRGAGVAELAGLEYALNLTALDLSGNPVTDLTPLAWLRNLRVLGLRGVEAPAWPLSTLAGLRRLSLRGAGLADISPLSWLQELEVLDLSGNPVLDLSPLAGMQRLRALRIDAGAADLSPLAGLGSLDTLEAVGAEAAHAPAAGSSSRSPAPQR